MYAQTEKKEENMTDYRDMALELVEDGMVDPNWMLLACLKYMSQDEVRDMLDANELSERFEIFEE
jgi:hypothetical protein